MFRNTASTLVLLFTLFIATLDATAQCPGCIANVTCTATPAYPTLCPAQPPEATAGEYYETDITFWLPTTFTDPGTGFNVTFNQMTITSVTGLPFGLSLETNEPSGVYFPQQDQYGCGRICGTPLGAGTFEVTISIIAGVTFSGIDVDAPEQFVIPLVVLPGSGSNSSFTFTPTTGCGTVDVDFQSLIDASPQPMAWDWDFGNGNTSSLQTPPTQTYDEPGTYTITLETTINGHVLESVSVTALNENWCGDVEETFCNCGTPIIGTCPDLYFTLNNANGTVYTSGTNDGTTNTNWSNLGLLLQDPPYSITIWDEDVASQNDDLGTYDLVLGSGGNYTFDVAGGTTGFLWISLQPQQQFSDTDTIFVFGLPEVVVNQDLISGELCVQDTLLSSYTWFLDGDTVPDATGPCVVPTGPGLWSAVGTNGFGCTAQSNTIIICPEIEITRNGPVLSVDNGFNGYFWSFGGAGIPGGDGPSITATADGTYTVVVQADNDCEITATYTYSTVDIDDLEATGGGMLVYPVPNDGAFTVEAAGLEGPMAGLRIADMSGRIVHERQQTVAQGRLRSAVLFDVAPGPYVVELQAGGRRFMERIIVQ